VRAIPILIISDGPDRQTGLSRICRDLAVLLARMPEYRVATLGLGALGSRQLPFQQYAIQQTSQLLWGSNCIEHVWGDFAGRERGVVFTIWDASRLTWFGLPRTLPDGDLKSFLSSHHFAKWGYFPIDGYGPGGRLSGMTRDTIAGFDRVLTYTKWAEGVVRGSLGDDASNCRALTWLPHGLNLDRWTIRSRDEARLRMSASWHQHDVIVGINMTNQPRKDWGLAAATCAGLREKVRNLRLWWHTDLVERHWSLPALVTDFGLSDITEITTSLSDDDLAWAYNACDLVMLPSLGEGFGYPVFEALACGTPVLTGDYAGCADVLSQCWQGDNDGAHDFLIPPREYRLDTLYNVLRPVFAPEDWVAGAERIIAMLWERDALRASVAHLGWTNLYAVWERWFKEGVAIV
jgi:glycosyltransferase involved in cell wall biosynthesis